MPDPRVAWMREAIALALEAVQTGSGGPFGALVVRGSEVLGRGRNRVLERHDPTAHAEIEAIRAACAKVGSHELTGCEIYTSCEPCPMCLGAMLWARVERCVFAGTRADAAAAGFDDARFHVELARPLAERSLPSVPFLREEALAAFDVWLARQDRRTY